MADTSRENFAALLDMVAERDHAIAELTERVRLLRETISQALGVPEDFSKDATDDDLSEDLLKMVKDMQASITEGVDDRDPRG